MLSMYKRRHRLSKQKLLRCRPVQAMFGHQACGIGQAVGTFGALAFGLVRPLATAHGTVAVGIKHQAVAGITVADIGVKFFRQLMSRKGDSSRGIPESI